MEGHRLQRGDQRFNSARRLPFSTRSHASLDTHTQHGVESILIGHVVLSISVAMILVIRVATFGGSFSKSTPNSDPLAHFTVA